MEKSKSLNVIALIVKTKKRFLSSIFGSDLFTNYERFHLIRNLLIQSISFISLILFVSCYTYYWFDILYIK